MKSRATELQLLAQITQGKSLAWLAGSSGWAEFEIDEFAERHGYVFGSNGVPRRSAVPVEPDPIPRADDSPEGAELSQELPEVAQARADDAASLAGGDELIARDVLDDQAALELDRALDAIEELDWPTLVDLGDASPVPETNELAEHVRADVDTLRARLIEERDSAQSIEQLREHVLAAEQLEVQLRTLQARIDELVPDAAVRAWARGAGVTCPARGRLPVDIRRAYVAQRLRDAS